MKRYIGLVHHPIVDKRGTTVTTSVTNLDIHDIARSARTFGFDGYFIVTPIVKQHALVQTILDHWNTDYGNDYNPDRQDALSFISLANTIEDAKIKIKEETGLEPVVVVFPACDPIKVLSLPEVILFPELSPRIVLLIFRLLSTTLDIILFESSLISPIYIDLLLVLS